jgi:Tfp pilus assembly protein PilO
MSLVERIGSRPPVQRRAIALLVLVALLVLAWTMVILPARWIVSSQAEWRVEVRRDLARARGRAAIEEDLAKRIAELPGAAVWHAFYEARPGYDVTAALQQEITSLSAAAGITPEAVTPLPRMQRTGLVGYGVRFRATMTADQLRRLAGAVRTNSHYLRVERIAVAAPQIQPVDQNASLMITLDVYGYARGQS